MILPRNKYRAFGYFASATLFYGVFAFQLLTGMIPRGSGDPAKFYRENMGFYWTYITIIFLVFLYHALRGIYLYWKRLRRDTDPPAANGFTPRIAGLITSAIIIPFGLCFLILPIVELVMKKTFGGIVFGNHLMANEAGAFWSLLIFHVLIGLIPIFGGTLLFLFPPRHVALIPENAAIETAPNGKPRMRTRTKVIIGSAAAVLLIGILGVAGIVGGSYYLVRKLDDPELVKKKEAAKRDGAEFGKTTDQNGCMERAYSLEIPKDSFDLSNDYFIKACLKSSRPTASFCDGVPLMLDRDWFKNQCSAVGQNTDACIDAFRAKRDFCRLDGDR